MMHSSKNDCFSFSDAPLFWALPLYFLATRLFGELLLIAPLIEFNESLSHLKLVSRIILDIAHRRLSIDRRILASIVTEITNGSRVSPETCVGIRAESGLWG